MVDESKQSKSFVGNKLNPILDILSKVAEGDLTARLRILKNEDEFNELSVLINRVIETLDDYKQKAEKNKIKAQNTKDFYEQILGYMDCGVFVTDKEDLIRYANNGMGEITDIEPQEIEGKIVLRDFSEETLKYFRSFYLKAKKTLKSVFYDSVPVVYSPKRSIYQSGWIIPIIKDNKYDGMICTAVDVTRRKSAEQGQKKSEEKLKNVFAANPEITYITDSDGNIMDANPTMLNTFGLSEKEIKKKNTMDIFVGTEDENFKQVIDKLNDGETLQEFVVKGEIAGGEKRVFSINANPLKENNNMKSFLFVAQDITDYKKMVDELQFCKMRFKNVFDSAVVSLWEEDYSEVYSLIEDIKAKGVTDFRKYIKDNPYLVHQAAQKVKIIDVNEEALKLFGAKDKKEMLMSLSKIFLPETAEKFKDQIIAMAERKDRFSTDYVMKNIHGDNIHVLSDLTLPSNESQSKSVIVSFRNIIQRETI